MDSESSIWTPVHPIHPGLYGLADVSAIDPLVDAAKDFDRAQITADVADTSNCPSVNRVSMSTR